MAACALIMFTGKENVVYEKLQFKASHHKQT